MSGLKRDEFSAYSRSWRKVGAGNAESGTRGQVGEAGARKSMIKVSILFAEFTDTRFGSICVKVASDAEVGMM